MRFGPSYWEEYSATVQYQGTSRAVTVLAAFHIEDPALVALQIQDPTLKKLTRWRSQRAGTSLHSTL